MKDLGDEEVGDLWKLAKKVGEVVESEYKAEGLTMAIQDGESAGQTVPQVHVHVVPRTIGDFHKNDDVYKEADRAEKEEDQARRLDNEERRPRDADDMAQEAARLRTLMPPELTASL